ncbi:MAG: hypothetical protein JSU74_07425 [Candidatus Zixiibacteriota bacterium]|nr:MAG: hypothetical protein JSU74_07425 [candidate division Zixibacteria bacterium]
MLRISIGLTVFAVIWLIAIPAMASSVSLGVSGPGVVNDSTIKAGEKVSFDVYIENDAEFTCFTLGFKIGSNDIVSVTHLADSGNGKNPNGDIKAFNGFDDASIWDLGGMHVVESNWDGKLPELVGFGGLAAFKKYMPHDRLKTMSWDMSVDSPGTLVVDSSFFPPGGLWVFGQPKHIPEWGGPYIYLVVE